MIELPERGPVILWTGPEEYRLIGEVFRIDGGLVVVRAHWPDADAQHAAHFIPWENVRQEYQGRGPVYLWPMEDDDPEALRQSWAEWDRRRQDEGHTRDKAREYAERCLDITLE